MLLIIAYGNVKYNTKMTVLHDRNTVQIDTRTFRTKKNTHINNTNFGMLTVIRLIIYNSSVMLIHCNIKSQTSTTFQNVDDPKFPKATLNTAMVTYVWHKKS